MSNINHTQRSASWSRASAVTERNHAQGIAAVRSSSEHLRSQSVPRLSLTEGVNLPTAETRTGRTAVRRAYGAYRAAPITPDTATPGLQATFNVEKKQPISISKAKSKAANPQMPTPAFKTVSKVSKPSSSGASGAIPKATAKPIKLNLEAFLSTAKSTQRYKPDSQASARYRPEPRRRFVVESDTDSDSDDDLDLSDVLSSLMTSEKTKAVNPKSKATLPQTEITEKKILLELDKEILMTEIDLALDQVIEYAKDVGVWRIQVREAEKKATLSSLINIQTIKHDDSFSNQERLENAKIAVKKLHLKITGLQEVDEEINQNLDQLVAHAEDAGEWRSKLFIANEDIILLQKKGISKQDFNFKIALQLKNVAEEIYESSLARILERKKNFLDIQEKHLNLDPKTHNIQSSETRDYDKKSITATKPKFEEIESTDLTTSKQELDKKMNTALEKLEADSEKIGDCNARVEELTKEIKNYHKSSYDEKNEGYVTCRKMQKAASEELGLAIEAKNKTKTLVINIFQQILKVINISELSSEKQEKKEHLIKQIDSIFDECIACNEKFGYYKFKFEEADKKVEAFEKTTDYKNTYGYNDLISQRELAKNSGISAEKAQENIREKINDLYSELLELDESKIKASQETPIIDSSQSKVLDEIEPAQPRQISFIHSDSKKDEAKAEKEKSEDSTEDMPKTATTTKHYPTLTKHYGAKPATPKSKKRSISLPFLKGFTKGKQKTPLAEIPPRILTSDSFYDTMLSDEEKKQYEKCGFIKKKQPFEYQDAWELYSGHLSEKIAYGFKAKILSLLSEKDTKNLNIIIRPIINRAEQWELYAGYFSEQSASLIITTLQQIYSAPLWQDSSHC